MCIMLYVKDDHQLKGKSCETDYRQSAVMMRVNLWFEISASVVVFCISSSSEVFLMKWHTLVTFHRKTINKSEVLLIQYV